MALLALSLVVSISTTPAYAVPVVPDPADPPSNGQSANGQPASSTAPKDSSPYASAYRQAQADEVAKILDQWLVELEDASNRYYEAYDRYKLALADMDVAKARIEVAQARLDATQAMLAGRVSSMYKGGPTSFIDVLFGATSFEDFTTRWDYLGAINEENARLIEESRKARLDAEEAHAAYLEQERAAEAALAEADEIRRQAQVTVAAYEGLYTDLEAEVAALIDQELAEEERVRTAEAQAAAQARAAAEAQAIAEQEAYQGYTGGVHGNGNKSYDPSTYSSVVEAAYSRINSPYVWAAEGPNTFDCSGLVTWCYRQVGIELPHQSEAQITAAPNVLLPEDAEPGDILWKPGHIGIYVGEGKFIHAPSPGSLVRIQEMEGYPWVFAGRF
jgi:cell wall-associated NlpC family hydrolase